MMAQCIRRELAIFFRVMHQFMREYEKKEANDQYFGGPTAKKEWGMIAHSTVFICLAVWMDLRLLNAIRVTTLLARMGQGF